MANRDSSQHSRIEVVREYSRRDMLRLLGAAGAAAAVVAGGGARALAAGAGPAQTGTPLKAKAKAVIQIWVWGGPCHIDTFDPKPEAGNDYCGPLDHPIETNVSGIRISELMPLLAKQADKYSIIRSMTHGQNGHETASYLVQTGRMPGSGLVFPAVGAVVSHFKGYGAGYKGLLPPYIVLTELQGRFSEVGFLPTRCKPFATGGDPGQSRFVVEGVVAQGISDKRQQERRELLGKLDTLGRAMPDDPQIAAGRKCENEAYDLIMGEEGKVFDLATETDELRDAYGRTTFGQSCLMARRLVERGVPYVTINYKGWDTHKQHFQAMRRKLPETDKGLATLLTDLSDRGLLDSTIIWCSGEFGRTPRVQWEPPWMGGRGHWGNVFSTFVAGGGFKGGHVVGSSDEHGAEVKDRPVYPCDLIASMYELLGIAPDTPLPHPQGLKITAVPGKEEKIKSGGKLTEIM